MDKKQTWKIVYWSIALMLLFSLQDAWQSAIHFKKPPMHGFGTPSLTGNSWPVP